MTKKELILHSTTQFQNNKSFHLLERIESTCLVKSLATVYSRLLEERVTARRTLKLLHAQVAMGALLLLGGVSLLFAIMLCAWAVLAICQCRA